MNIAERIAKRMEVAAKPTKKAEASKFVKLSMSKIRVTLVDPEKYNILITTTSTESGYRDFFKYLGFVPAKNSPGAWRKTFGALKQTTKSWLIGYKKKVAAELVKWNAAEGKPGKAASGKTAQGKKLTVAQLKKKVKSGDTADITKGDLVRLLQNVLGTVK